MDTVEELGDTYFYHGYSNLTPGELFNLIYLENFSNHLDLEISAAALILSGQAWVPAPGKPIGAKKGTSIASMLSRKVLNDMRFPNGKRLLTPVGNRMQPTNKIGSFVGRYIPWVGYGQLVITLMVVAKETRNKYNLIARPKDRIEWAAF
ncbi:membrane protein [Yersinia aldovae]|uniref:STM2901 family protein n=1 Tax=Yersinia aldovae TaxID=29483 RepID=UPI0005DCBC17|nr:hypothetical protein [Yersinia aldovae]CNH61148.1 membrane protein [Yersinia aldovae]